MSWTTAAFNNITFFLLTKFDSKFDMREGYCWRSNDACKDSRKENEWLGNVLLSLKIFNDEILGFLPILSHGA